MTSPIPFPPAAFPSIRVEILGPDRILHRNHDSRFDPTVFNPGKGQPSRVSPFTAAVTGLLVPTLYAVTSREAAAHETVFHDIKAVDLLKSVNRGALESRAASQIVPRRELKLASLFAPDLMAWNLTRRELIDTPKTAYGRTVKWAQAIHGADPSLDGLLWTSRRCDPDLCIVLFGDRVESTEFDVVDRLAAAYDTALMHEFHMIGRRAVIEIVS